MKRNYEYIKIDKEFKIKPCKIARIITLLKENPRGLILQEISDNFMGTKIVIKKILHFLIEKDIVLIKPATIFVKPSYYKSYPKQTMKYFLNENYIYLTDDNYFKIKK